MDFGDDSDPQLHARKQTQTKISSALAASTEIDLNIHKRKRKIMERKTVSTNQITLDGEALEEVETPTT